MIIVVLFQLMEPRLIQQQVQKMVLSPQIRQYLKLLQMPLMVLQQAVELELSENPLLEEKEPERPEESLSLSDGAAPARESSAEEIRLGETFDHFIRMDENFRESYDSLDFSQRDVSDMEKQKSFRESLITKPEALSDFLLWQIRFLDLTVVEKNVAEEIIGNMDDDGFLKATLEEIAQASLQDLPSVEKVLRQIQELEPPGIAARNLQEALVLQLQRKGPEAQIALEIVSKHLPLLEKRDFAHLAKILSVAPVEIQKAVAIVSRLEPRPGRTFYAEEPIAVVPDATVSMSEDEDSDSKFKIEIHDEVVPELRINAYYRRLLKNKNTDEKTKVFLREKMQDALNFIKALKLRKSTIREITEEIVKVQPEFFEKGFAYLRPLRLKDISHTIGVHESTVSRALSGKYISTPQGTIPYKSFFSTKLETTNGELASQKSIMEKIRALVEKEAPKDPFSDQEIVEVLQAEGIVIARRTVAKYRDLLRIFPSHLRRSR